MSTLEEHELEQALITEAEAQAERDRVARMVAPPKPATPARLPVENAAHVRVRYLPPSATQPSRYIASWIGWASDDYRRVTRRLDYVSDTVTMAREAAIAYCRWLSAGPESFVVTPVHVTIGYDGANQWSILVSTKVGPKPEKVILT